MNKEIVQKAIQEGDLEKAIAAFKEINLSNQNKKTLSIIEAEFNILQEEILKGTIDTEQRQLRTNRINDKILTLLSTKDKTVQHTGKIKKLSLLLIPIGIVLAFFLYQFISTTNTNCPTFNKDSKNKILLIPFENVGNAISKPHVLLRDRIDQIAIENNLSINIQLGEQKEDITINEAPKIAQTCDANVIIWGKYSNAADSLRLILQYYFIDKPEWSNTNELVVLKDVTSIQNGKMLKDLEDSIMSLCGIIALRQNKLDLSKKWFNKVKAKDEMDHEFIHLIDDIPVNN